jgi:hypothetical protein
VHHIAFRAADDAQQAQMSEKLVRNHSRQPTEQKDRNYFRSIYFREPGGVLFEIATDIPGFAIDEPAKALGRDLKLPKFLESRKEIEGLLPVLETADEIDAIIDGASADHCTAFYGERNAIGRSSATQTLTSLAPAA